MMPNETKTAQNIHRTMLLQDAPMGDDQTSKVIDWKDMTVGSIQVFWQDNDAFDGSIVVEASNFRPDETLQFSADDLFDEIDTCADGDILLSDDGSKGSRKTKIFNLGVIGYRYSRVKYFKGSNTDGRLTIMALGKKNG